MTEYWKNYPRSSCGHQYDCHLKACSRIKDLAVISLSSNFADFSEDSSNLFSSRHLIDCIWFGNRENDRRLMKICVLGDLNTQITDRITRTYLKSQEDPEILLRSDHNLFFSGLL